MSSETDLCLDSGSYGNFNRVRSIYTDRGSALKVSKTLTKVMSAISARRAAISEETEEKHQLGLAYKWLSALSMLCQGTISQGEITPQRRQLVVNLLQAALAECKVDRDADYFRNAIKECR